MPARHSTDASGRLPGRFSFLQLLSEPRTIPKPVSVTRAWTLLRERERDYNALWLCRVQRQSAYTVIAIACWSRLSFCSSTKMNTVSAHAQVQHTQRPSCAFQALVRPSQHQRNGKCSSSRSVTVRAEKSGLQRLLQPFEGLSKEEDVSFRWNPANLRWEQSKTKMADDASMMITPLIGAPYLVSPAL